LARAIGFQAERVQQTTVDFIAEPPAFGGDDGFWKITAVQLDRHNSETWKTNASPPLRSGRLAGAVSPAAATEAAPPTGQPGVPQNGQRQVEDEA
jgi:hypothetical protein